MNDITYECSSGWDDLIDDTLEKIRTIDPEIKILQVKEKFGTLRIYWYSTVGYDSPQSMLIQDIVRGAERHSEKVCEVCGMPGELRLDRSWDRTLCDRDAAPATI